jgi:CheY-like chemotaxis protein
MQETVRAAVKLIRTGLPPSIEIATEVAEESPPVLGDASRLHQVVLNLCTNAAQAIGQEKGRIEVRLSHEGDDPSGDSPLGWVIMEVKDDGPGVIEPIRKRVFEPFFTTNPPGEGPGLGLSVVHGIVTSHGGSVTFDSEPGRGTVVTMRFPATARVRLHERPPPKSLRRSLSVLVVDDEEAVAEVTRSILEAYGHSVTSVTDPYRALKELRDRPGHFDVILTDYSMPGLTGLDLVDAVRDLAPRAGVVLSSGYNLADRHLNNGVIHLAKPFTTAQLADTVLRAKAMASPDPDT